MTTKFQPVILFFPMIFLISSSIFAQSNPNLSLTIVNADIVGNELVWSAEKSAHPDLQAEYTQTSGSWSFIAGPKNIQPRRLGTPLKTDGVIADFFSAKSVVKKNYLATCFTDVVGSSGVAGNFSTTYLILRLGNEWHAFSFYSEEGCAGVRMKNPRNITVSYDEIDITKSGWVFKKSVSITNANVPNKLVSKNKGKVFRQIVNKNFVALRDSLIVRP
jgi:hypothetical protein